MRIFITAIVIAVLQIYYFKRLKNVLLNLFPSINYKNWKKYRLTVIIACNIYPVLLILYFSYSSLTGTRMSPIYSNYFDFLILYPFWVYILIVIQTLLILIIPDIVYISLKKLLDLKVSSFYAKFSLAVFLLFAVYVPGRIIYDMNSVNIEKIILNSSGNEAEEGGISIAFISDLQADWYTDESRLINYIEKVNSLNPELVLIGGDIVTSTPNYIELGAEYLSKIEADYGVYSCVGDHDNWVYRGDMMRSRNDIKSALDERGIEFCDNENRILELKNLKIGISFVTDTYSDRIHTKELDDLKLSGDSLDYKILLSHQPAEKIIDFAKAANYDLMLAGHTHGGQITLFFPFYNITPTLLETDLVRGKFQLENLVLIVNSGLGVSLSPIRYNSTPEVTQLLLN